MSIIVYGPRGCGKTRNKKKLMEYFCCDNVVECEEPLEIHNPYPISRKQTHEFNCGTTLFLTTEEPPARLKTSRRIFPFHLAASAAGIK